MAAESLRRQVLLVSCGSFNPVTHMHLRLFELARDFLHRSGKYKVIGGMILPTHDKYGKKDLIEAEHRVEMSRLALKTSDWIRLDDWETKQENWTETFVSMQRALKMVREKNAPYNWPESACEDSKNVQVKLLCGADLLESFSVPGLWKEEHMKSIVSDDFGLVVITREGSNPHQFISTMDFLKKNENNIHIVQEYIPNEISSTKIRQAVRCGDSIKYLIPDPVIDYIIAHQLYRNKRTNVNEVSLEEMQEP